MAVERLSPGRSKLRRASAVEGEVQPAVVSAEGPARDAPPEETSSLSGALFKKAKTHVTLMAKSLGERWSPKKRTDDHAKRLNHDLYSEKILGKGW